MHRLGSLLLVATLTIPWIVPTTVGGVPSPGANCRSCHEMVDVLSHPMGPAGSHSGGLPLEPGGLIGCVTCHDDRVLQADHGSSTSGEGLLRRSTASLCASCHQEGDGGSTLVHGLSMGRAHLEFSGLRDVSLTWGESPGLDGETRGCLGCHDGSLAGSASVTEDGAVRRPRGAMQAEHPIGVRYDGPGTVSSRRAQSLRPAASLPREIRLSEGRVGCGSCHSVYSTEPAMLVRPTRRGDLCLGCHIK